MQKQFNLLLRLLGMLLFITLAGYITWYFLPYLKSIMGEPEILRLKLLSYGNWSRLVFMGLQVLQVVAAPLPGELVQVAGGYVFGFWAGTLYSLAGIFIGSLIAFFLSHWLGYPLLQALIKQETLEKFRFLLDSNRAEVLIFILFLIPGAPKDILTFIAGITPIRPAAFFLAAMLGRFPGIAVSALLGAQLEKQEYLLTAIVSCLIAILFLLGFLYREKLIHLLRRHHSK